jgi:hypothetical protein
MLIALSIVVVMPERSAARMDSILRRTGASYGYGWGYDPKTRGPRHSAAGLIRAQIIGRGGAIRTLDLLNPIQVRYQAAPRPDRSGV